MAQLVEASCCRPEDCRFDSQSGSNLGCGVWPLVRECTGGNWLMFLSLQCFSLSLLPSVGSVNIPSVFFFLKKDKKGVVFWRSCLHALISTASTRYFFVLTVYLWVRVFVLLFFYCFIFQKRLWNIYFYILTNQGRRVGRRARGETSSGPCRLIYSPVQVCDTSLLLTGGRQVEYS